jgi:hypothetical protein
VKPSALSSVKVSIHSFYLQHRSNGQLIASANQTIPIDGSVAYLSARNLEYHFQYSVSALVVGSFTVVAGVIMIFLRRNGRTCWRMKVKRCRIELTTNVTGIILALIGFLIIYFTRFHGGP